MVRSKFNLAAYLSICIFVLITAVPLFITFSFLSFRIDDIMASVFIFIPYVAYMGYLLYKIRIIEIYDTEVRYKSAVFPFLKGCIALEDADYYVTQKVYGNAIIDYRTIVKVIKNGNVILSVPSSWYSNLQELADALPWEYWGEYKPGFFDYFRLFSINERRIVGPDDM